MYTEVYVDVLFLINFSMDAVSLFVTARLCALKSNIWFISLAAGIGAVYSVLALFIELAAIFETITFVSVSLIMVSVGFRPSDIRETLKTSSVLFISSALLGGLMSALYSIMADLLKGANYTSDTSYLTPSLIIILAIVSLCASLFLTRLHGTGNLPDFGEVEIVLWNEKKTLRGVFDTGNLLTEPLSGRAVIIVKASCLRGIVSDFFIKEALSADTLPRLLTDRERVRFRLVPAKGIGGSTYLYGLIPDGLTVIYTCRSKIKKCKRDAVIAVMRDDSEEFECIIPSSII